MTKYKATINIDRDVWDEFIGICKANETTATAEVVAFIKAFVTEQEYRGVSLPNFDNLPISVRSMSEIILEQQTKYIDELVSRRLKQVNDVLEERIETWLKKNFLIKTDMETDTETDLRTDEESITRTGIETDISMDTRTDSIEVENKDLPTGKGEQKQQFNINSNEPLENSNDDDFFASILPPKSQELISQEATREGINQHLSNRFSSPIVEVDAVVTEDSQASTENKLDTDSETDSKTDNIKDESSGAHIEKKECNTIVSKDKKLSLRERLNRRSFSDGEVAHQEKLSRETIRRYRKKIRKAKDESLWDRWELDSSGSKWYRKT